MGDDVSATEKVMRLGHRVSCRNIVEVDSLHDQKNGSVIFNPEALVEAMGSVIVPGLYSI